MVETFGAFFRQVGYSPELKKRDIASELGCSKRGLGSLEMEATRKVTSLPPSYMGAKGTKLLQSMSSVGLYQ